MKPTVGQKVWVGYSGPDSPLTEHEVVRVGRKYFNVKIEGRVWNDEPEFDIEDWESSFRSRGNYAAYAAVEDRPLKFAAKEKARQEQAEKEKLTRKFSDWYFLKKLTLDQLRRMEAITLE